MFSAVAYAASRYRKKDMGWMEIIPGLFPLLGLVLTMAGVMYGLYQYDHKNLDSIDNLFNGLKLAFLGSIIGVAASMVFQILGKRTKDQQEKSDPWLKFSEKVVYELGRLNDGVESQNRILAERFHLINEANEVIYNELKNDARLKEALQTFVEEIGRGNEQLLRELQRVGKGIESLNNTQTNHFNALNSAGEAILNELELARDAQDGSLRTIRETLENAAEKAALHHQEHKALLEGLGAELQKNNTEALVKVMQSATEEFNRHMSAIVDRLVKENFQELNAAVQNMLGWQSENKAAMELLGERYAEYVQGLESTRRELSEIARLNAAMSGPNGQLAALVAELKKLLYDEKPLADIVSKMLVVMNQATQQLEHTNALNDKIKTWSSQFKGLEDTTVRLVKSIDDMRNFESDVWKNYRNQMQEAVSIVKRSQEELRDSMKTAVKGWNEAYANNLTGVFRTLDKLFKTYIESLERQ